MGVPSLATPIPFVVWDPFEVRCERLEDDSVPDAPFSLTARDVGFHYPGQQSLLEDVRLSVEPGSLTMLIGPNGAGKSTLMKILAGLLQPAQGAVQLQAGLGEGSRDLAELSPLARARTVAYLPQEVLLPEGYTVQEVVLLGRFPHQRWWTLPGERDRKIMDEALEHMGVAHLGNRAFESLSGGEQQAVLLAGVLAQQSPLLLLDEPGKGLDVHHLATFSRRLRRLARAGRGILCITHDLNLASRFADVVYLLSDRGIRARGRPEQVLTQALVAESYGSDVEVTRDARSGLPVVLPGSRLQEPAEAKDG